MYADFQFQEDVTGILIVVEVVRITTCVVPTCSNDLQNDVCGELLMKFHMVDRPHGINAGYHLAGLTPRV